MNTDIIYPQKKFEVVMKTPFGSFFKALYELKFQIEHVNRISKPIKRIMKSYSPTQDRFVIGKILHIITDDIDLTFELPKVGKEVVLFPKTHIYESYTFKVSVISIVIYHARAFNHCIIYELQF